MIFKSAIEIPNLPVFLEIKRQRETDLYTRGNETEVNAPVKGWAHNHSGGKTRAGSEVARKTLTTYA